MWVVEDDPDAAWPELAPCFLRELQEYSTWKQAGIPRPGEEPVTTIDELRAQGRFDILTPADARARVASGDVRTAVVHPLAGGVPLERAWAQLRRFVDAVEAGRRDAAAEGTSTGPA